MSLRALVPSCFCDAGLRWLEVAVQEIRRQGRPQDDVDIAI